MRNTTVQLDHSAEALEALAPELRQSIHLVHYSGFTTEEVAGLLGEPLDVIEERLRAAETELAA